MAKPTSTGILAFLRGPTRTITKILPLRAAFSDKATACSRQTARNFTIFWSGTAWRKVACSNGSMCRVRRTARRYRRVYHRATPAPTCLQPHPGQLRNSSGTTRSKEVVAIPRCERFADAGHLGRARLDPPKGHDNSQSLAVALASPGLPVRFSSRTRQCGTRVAACGIGCPDGQISARLAATAPPIGCSFSDSHVRSWGAILVVCVGGLLIPPLLRGNLRKCGAKPGNLLQGVVAGPGHLPK